MRHFMVSVLLILFVATGHSGEIQPDLPCPTEETLNLEVNNWLDRESLDSAIVREMEEKMSLFIGKRQLACALPIANVLAQYHNGKHNGQKTLATLKPFENILHRRVQNDHEARMLILRGKASFFPARL